jgi:pimeloyl-ACP methyl ester carboxylesterase
MSFRPPNNPPPNLIGKEKSDCAVLFVHGLAGSYWTWYRFSVHLNENWTENDSFNLEYDEYYNRQDLSRRPRFIRSAVIARRILFGPGIDKLSEHLRTVISQSCDEFDNVIIVAHSMGGLVARQYILDQVRKEKSLGKVKALITYATPHHGSVWANRIKLFINFIFPRISSNSQLSQLQQNQHFIDRLNRSWSALNIDDKIEFKRVVGLYDWVVDEESSAFKDDPNVFKVAKNHFNIIVPDKKKDPAFMVTYNFLKKFRSTLDSEHDGDEINDEDAMEDEENNEM